MSSTPAPADRSPGIQCLFPGPDRGHGTETQQLPHVLLILDGFPKTLGGGERIVLRLAALLPRYGFRASILTLSIHPESIFRPSDAPCPVYLLPLSRTYDLRALRAAVELRRFLRAQKIDIVQTFFESSDLWAGAVTRALSPAKLIWSRRDMGILRGRKHALAYRLLRHLPHAVFAVSDEVRRHVIEIDGVPAERVQTIHNGLNLASLEALQPVPRNSDQPVILTVGNIRRVKGHDLLVEAAAEVVHRFPQAVFEVAGEILDPDFFAELQRRIGELGLQDRFRFLGGVADLRTCMQRATLFVLPSRSEGFSNALIEAMACSLPVIATRVGGNAEAVQTEVSGLVIPPEDSSALAAAILRILSSPKEAQSMAEAARQRVYTDFTADAMMRKLVASYRDILQR